MFGFLKPLYFEAIKFGENTLWFHDKIECFDFLQTWYAFYEYDRNWAYAIKAALRFAKNFFAAGGNGVFLYCLIYKVTLL